jgi:hypothetical protein
MLKSRAPSAFARLSNVRALSSLKHAQCRRPQHQKRRKVRKDVGDVVDNIDGRQKVRCLEEKKQREASISENWNVVSFWVKLFAFSGLLMAQVAGWAESLGRVDGYRKI